MTHGSEATEVIAPRSRLYQGPFGRLFRTLPPWSLDGKSLQQLEAHFLGIANNEMIEDDTAPLDSQIPAGYTYFGQFVDHDITFDPASELMRENDPNGLLNHRTPRLDLDSLYGSGPKASPHLYQHNDPDKFLIGSIAIAGGTLPDLPRNQEGRALIGDPRNDENSIVSQLHLAFLLAHNTLVDRARTKQMTNPFEAAKNTLRWLYQHIVWHDFIARIARGDVFQNVLKQETKIGTVVQWKSELEDIFDWRNQPFMPVEFSVAAYRFGHSMVRNTYQTNFPHRGFHVFASIFDNTLDANGQPNPNPDDLRGARPIPVLNYIQWDWFLQMKSSTGEFPQLARKIDTKLAKALTALHEGPAGSSMNILAFRNLLRGASFDLPSGSGVARKLGLVPIFKDTEHDMLWFYILNEADVQQQGERLGQVGSVIVCATFAGLLLGDPFSYFNMQPQWTPEDDNLLLKGGDADSNSDNRDSAPGTWTLASIIRLAGLPVAASDFPPTP